MFNYFKRIVANNPKVKKMSRAQRKKLGGRIILYSTLLLFIPITCLFLSYHNLMLQIFFQLVWGISMILGSLIAFDGDEKQSGTR
ncbi:Uncharacterised protein [Yersinia enterocolitica]|nr:Uncharacterised protein [Yersinia enterocolitica]